MALQGISTGVAPNDGLGDTLLVGAVKINKNFQEIYNAIGNGTTIFSGDPNIDVGFITATGAYFSGNVTIGSTLTYEDVTNIDSVGLITARDGIAVLGAGITVAGVSTFYNATTIGAASTFTNTGLSVGSAVTITATGVNVTGIVTATTFSGNLPTTDLTGTITNAQLAGSIENGKLTNSSIGIGGLTFSLGDSDTTPAFDLSDATNYPTSSLSGTISNAQLAGSIANAKLSNDSVSFGGVSLDLGGSDATPAFNLSDATDYPTSSLSGTITNAQLAGSIADGKLASTFLKNVVEDTTPQLGGNLSLNSNTINGTGNINFTGTLTATSIVKSGGTSSQFLKANGSVDSSTYLTSLGTAILDGDFTSNGFMKRTGAGSYTVDTSTYLTTTGNGSGLTNLTGSNISSGTVPVARIGTGTKSASTYYRGNGTFATISSSSLSDTVEGTWTPVFEGATTAGTYTYGSRTGTYIRVGNLVTATCNMTNIATSSAGSGIIQIGQLPVNSSSSKGVAVGSITITQFNTTTNCINVTCELAEGVGKMTVVQSIDASNSVSLAVTDKINDGADIRLTITYFAD